MERNGQDKAERFNKLKFFEPMVEWDNIEIGVSYHIPPLIMYGRKDFVVEKKEKNYINVRYDGETFLSTLYRASVASKFITKKWNIYDTK